jgi:hypothetical protein
MRDHGAYHQLRSYKSWAVRLGASNATLLCHVPGCLPAILTLSLTTLLPNNTVDSSHEPLEIIHPIFPSPEVTNFIPFIISQIPPSTKHTLQNVFISHPIPSLTLNNSPR